MLVPRFFNGLMLFVVSGVFSLHAQTNQDIVTTPSTDAVTSALAPTAPPTPLQEAGKLANQGKYDEALVKVNVLLQAEPQNIDALDLRGYIYTMKKTPDLAEKDFNTILQLNPKNIPAQFNLDELKFARKDYDAARPGFLSLVNDPDWGDLASYKVFLCDLFGGHADASKAELDVFNKAGDNPSYYFANAAWELYHQKPEAARPWLASAEKIYYPEKQKNYLFSLKNLGYLPLPPAQN